MLKRIVLYTGTESELNWRRTNSLNEEKERRRWRKDLLLHWEVGSKQEGEGTGRRSDGWRGEKVCDRPDYTFECDLKSQYKLRSQKGMIALNINNEMVLFTFQSQHLFAIQCSLRLGMSCSSCWVDSVLENMPLRPVWIAF